MPVKRRKVYARVSNSNVGELYLYDQIGGGLFGGGVSDTDVIEDLAECGGIELNIYINSPGGDVFQGTAIYNALKRYSAKKTVYVDGVCASIATIVAMAGDRIVTAPNATWMIHQPWAGVVGNAEYMRSMADRIDKLAVAMRDTYVARTKQSVDLITKLMAGDAASGETWLTAEEALKFGLTDEVSAFDGSGNAKAEFPLLDRYQGTPEPMRVAARSPRAVLASMSRQMYLDSLRRPAG